MYPVLVGLSRRIWLQVSTFPYSFSFLEAERPEEPCSNHPDACAYFYGILPDFQTPAAAHA